MCSKIFCSRFLRKLLICPGRIIDGSLARGVIQRARWTLYTYILLAVSSNSSGYKIWVNVMWYHKLIMKMTIRLSVKRGQIQYGLYVCVCVRAGGGGGGGGGGGASASAYIFILFANTINQQSWQKKFIIESHSPVLSCVHIISRLLLYMGR